MIFDRVMALYGSRPDWPDGERVETGPVQFGDDWPGLFIRGDDCCGFAGLLRGLINNHSIPTNEMMEAQRLIDLLESVKVK
jgi:hypothetical protein